MGKATYAIAAIIVIIVIIAGFVAVNSGALGDLLRGCPEFTEEEILATIREDFTGVFQDITLESVEETECSSGVVRYDAIINADRNRISVPLVGDGDGLRMPIG